MWLPLLQGHAAHRKKVNRDILQNLRTRNWTKRPECDSLQPGNNDMLKTFDLQSGGYIDAPGLHATSEQFFMQSIAGTYSAAMPLSPPDERPRQFQVKWVRHGFCEA